MCTNLCFMLFVVPFFHQAVHGRDSSGQVPGRFKCTIFQVHSASVTRHVVSIPKVPRWSGCGSSLKVDRTLSMETLPSVPATRSHMATMLPRRLSLLRARASKQECSSSLWTIELQRIHTRFSELGKLNQGPQASEVKIATKVANEPKRRQIGW